MGVDGRVGAACRGGGGTVEGRRGRQGAKFLPVDKNLYQFCLHFGGKRGNGEGGGGERERLRERGRQGRKSNFLLCILHVRGGESDILNIFMQTFFRRFDFFAIESVMS